MYAWLNDMSFSHLAWFGVIVYALHYAEEGPRLVGWFTKRNLSLVGIQLVYTQKKLNIENLLLFSFLVLVVVSFGMNPEHWFWQGMILGQAVGFIGNTYFHVKPTLIEGVYSPGVITAAMLNPIMLILYVAKAVQLNILTVPVVVVALVSGPIILPLFVLFTHKLLLKNS